MKKRFCGECRFYSPNVDLLGGNFRVNTTNYPTSRCCIKNTTITKKQVDPTNRYVVHITYGAVEDCLEKNKDFNCQDFRYHRSFLWRWFIEPVLSGLVKLADLLDRF